QQFTDKGPNNGGFDPNQTPRADLNSPFIRFDVGTTNLFDETNPFYIASDGPGLLGFTLFQNEQIPSPGNRDRLNAYITPVLTDVWNTAPYLHDGSAATLLDVVRGCVSTLDDCAHAGHGRNVDDLHGVTSFLSARQLNDLVAFEKAPHGPIGEVRAVNGVRMKRLALVVRFARKPGHGHDVLTMKGSADASQGQSINPVGEPVTLSVGVPAGDTLAAFERTIPAGGFRGNGARTSFRFTGRHGQVAEGVRSIVIKVKGNAVTFRATVRTDLSAIRVKDPDYTVALEIGENTIGLTRHFETNAKGTLTRVPRAGHRKR